MSTFLWGTVLGVCGCAPVLRYLGPTLAGLYVLAAAGLWTAAVRATKALNESTVRMATLAVLALAALLLAVLYPLANGGALGGGSDRDEALTTATLRLLAGQSPYAALTYLDNPITPLPGALLLSIPLVVLFKTTAPLALVALTTYARVVERAAGQRRAGLCCLGAFLLCAEGARDLVTGGDLLANSLCLATAILLTLTLRERGRLWAYAAVGLCLCWRLNFLLGLPLLLVAAARREGAGKALLYGAVMGLCGGLPAVAVYLWDPANFSPLHTLGKVAFLDTLMPGGSLSLVLLVGALAATLGLRGQPQHVLRDLGLVQAAFLGLAILVSLFSGHPALHLLGFFPVCTPFLLLDGVPTSANGADAPEFDRVARSSRPTPVEDRAQS